MKQTKIVLTVIRHLTPKEKHSKKAIMKNPNYANDFLKSQFGGKWDKTILRCNDNLKENESLSRINFKSIVNKLKSLPIIQATHDFKHEFISSNLFGNASIFSGSGYLNFLACNQAMDNTTFHDSIAQVKYTDVKINNIDAFVNWTNQLLRKDIANNIYTNEVLLERLINRYARKQNLTEKDHDYFNGLFKHLNDNITNVLISDYQIVVPTENFNNQLERIKGYFTNHAKSDEKYAFIIEYENSDSNHKDNHVVSDFPEKELYQIDLSKVDKNHLLKELTSFKAKFNPFNTLNQNDLTLTPSSMSNGKLWFVSKFSLEKEKSKKELSKDIVELEKMLEKKKAELSKM